MSTIIIEPHYLGSLEYFVLLSQYEEVCFEIHDSFPKQTFRNRAYVRTSNKIQPLIVPVRYSNGTATKDVLVDYSQRWMKDHWGAFYSGYGKAPFFEYFNEEFRTTWDNKPTRLIDLNLEFIRICFKILHFDIKISFTENYQIGQGNDFRNTINPKKPFSDRKIYEPSPYTQLFGDTFVPNLSIVDLIMCEGPNAAQILNKSLLRN
ncbi:WbqC family protein [Ekhidna sp. To15]|uniref:WbqC family protein n=1 Tax=Ekhidna sp. To15 TaxID=3395267 RepID=UPI003F51E8DE